MAAMESTDPDIVVLSPETPENANSKPGQTSKSSASPYQKYYKQAYRTSWESQPDFKGTRQNLVYVRTYPEQRFLYSNYESFNFMLDSHTIMKWCSIGETFPFIFHEIIFWSNVSTVHLPRYCSLVALLKFFG